MDDTFKIYILRLRDGQSEQIQESLPPDFLVLKEPDVAFNRPVEIRGEANLVDEMFVLTLDVETEATLPCSICNQDVQVKISIKDFCFTEPVNSIKSGIFNYQEILREALLLELPHTAECRGGDCPERETLAKYFSHKQNQEN